MIMIVLLFFSGILFLTLYLLRTRRMTVPFLFIYRKCRWTIGTIQTGTPLGVNSEKERIKPIPGGQFPCVPECVIMADPFVVRDQDDYYIFYEHAPSTINNPGADIWVLKSRDLCVWKQLGPVIKEPFHMSFPNVFRMDGCWYMLPETGAAKQIRLYKALDFPMEWTLESVLLDNIVGADSVLLRKEGVYYMLFQNNSDFSLRLYCSHELTANWKEHPVSPIRKNKIDTRPGGTLGYIGDQLIYFVQDSSFGYGTGLVAYQIDELSETVFKDHKIEMNPVLFRFGNSWASKGMHQLSWIQLDDGTYFCAVDGVAEAPQKIGWSWRNLPKLR